MFQLRHMFPVLNAAKTVVYSRSQQVEAGASDHVLIQRPTRLDLFAE